MKRPTAIVIGAGVGGLTVAAKLARHGCQVTVVEKNEGPGGRCDRLVHNGHIFDTGPTLLLMLASIAETFVDLGERIEDHLDLRRVDPTYHIHFQDGLELHLTADLHVMQDQLEAVEPGSFQGYLQYLKEGQSHFKLTLEKVVGRDFRRWMEYLAPQNLYLLLKLKALRRHYTHIGRYFRDSRLKAAFTFQDMYMGLNPYRAPATYSLLQYTELADGVWYPMGGLYTLVEALAGIAGKWGVQFIYNAPVAKINLKDQRATGVTLRDGRQLSADIVIANADLPYVYRHLLPVDGINKRLARMKYTCSAIMFYWGLTKPMTRLGVHNLFMAADCRRNYDNIFEHLTAPEEPGFYVHAPTRIDSSMAPTGQDTLVVAVPVAHMNDEMPQDWDAIKKQTRQLVLQRLAGAGCKGLEKAIKFEASITPRDWLKRYNLVKGANHSLSHNLFQVGYLRPRCQHTRYHNLYFVGAGTHPGTGLPSVLMSARHVATRILGEAILPKPVRNKSFSVGRKGLQKQLGRLET